MLNIYLLLLLLIETTIYISGTSLPCALRDYGEQNLVCVCNATYCDTITREPKISKDEYVIFTSSREGLRFHRSTGKFNESETQSDNSILSWIFGAGTKFTVNTTVRFQKIMGFGGAFTDAAGINILSLDKKAQEHLLRSYFSEDGIEYNLCRVPISGTDFSTRPYSYDDGTPDPQLEHFSLAKEDLKYKIPLIDRAVQMSERKINLVAASWSPPPWMKTNDDFSGFAFLKPEYYDLYAKYLIRFLDEYKKNNVTIWAMSTGNEPSNGVLPIKRFNSLGWTPLTIANWTTNYFGPQLRSSPFKDTLILAFDDQRLFLPWWIELMVEADQKVLNFIDGFAIHWYWDFIISANVIQTLHEKYPTKFLLYTEASQGDKPWEKKVDFGSWERGESYIKDIIENLNFWVTGWMDWNLALNQNGGPSWAKNEVDSPILVNVSAGEFYKQPMFYAIGHLSKFVERDAVRVQVLPTSSSGVYATAVQNPDGRIVIVTLNENNKDIYVSINLLEKGWINTKLPSRSFATILC